MPIEIPSTVSDQGVRFRVKALNLSSSPAYCREAARLGEEHVKTLLRMAAVDVYEQEKNTRMWAQNVRDGNNKLLWFINRVHVEKENSNTFSIRSAARDEHSELVTETATKPAEHNGRAKQGRIVAVRYVDLSLFEDLYYMTCAKVRELYQDLQLRINSGFVAMGQILHTRGRDLQAYGPFTARDMVDFLVDKWTILMNPSLVAALDDAVRKRNFEAALSGKDNEGLLITSVDDAQGLLDGNHMSIAELTMHVWWKNSPIIEKELIEEAERERARAVKRIEVHFERRLHGLTRKVPEHGDIGKDDSGFDHENFKGNLYKESPSSSKIFEVNKPQSVEGDAYIKTKQPKANEPNPRYQQKLSPTCKCSANCQCQEFCLAMPHEECMCITNPLFIQIMGQAQTEQEVRQILEKERGEPVGEDYLFGASSNEMAQMQIAAAAFGNNSELMKALDSMQKDIEEMEDRYGTKLFVNEHTKSPMTLKKKPKDQYPLDFYSSPFNGASISTASQSDGHRVRYDSVQSSAPQTPMKAGKARDPTDIGPPTPPKTRATDHVTGRAMIYSQVNSHPPSLTFSGGSIGSSTGSSPSIRAPFTDDQNFTAGALKKSPDLTPSKSNTSQNIKPDTSVMSILDIKASPQKAFHLRRYISAGGPGSVNDRPEVPWILPSPRNDSFRISGEQLMKMLPEPPRRANHGSGSSPGRDSGVGEGCYESKEGGGGRKRVPVGIRGGMRKLFRRTSSGARGSDK